MAADFNQQGIDGSFEFDALREARNYQRLLIDELKPALAGRVLEIGSGIGQMTQTIRAIPGIDFLQCVEPEAIFCNKFRELLPNQPLIQGTIEDVREKNWDGIVSINVLEHIKDDRAELKRYYQWLKKADVHKNASENKEGGLLALFVPARMELYAPLDKSFGHYRRYEKKELARKLIEAGFTIEKMRYYDFAGYFGWWLTCKLLKQERFSPASVCLFDRLIFPFENLLERNIITPPIGKNLLVIARAE